MIAGFNTHITTVVVADPAADGKVLALVAPPGAVRIERAYAFCQAAITSSPTNYLTISLLDGGADGTGTTSMGAAGGANIAWAANGGKALTMTQYDVDAGDHILIDYNEEGTVAPGNIGVVIHWVLSE